MRTIIFLIRKELIQLIRNKAMLRIIIVLPIVQLIVLVYAATFEIKRVDYVVVDYDHSTKSKLLINKYSSISFYHLVDVVQSDAIAKEIINQNLAKIAIIIPKDFEKSIINNQPIKLQFIINSIDGAAAGLIQSYSLAIEQDFLREVLINSSMANSQFIIPQINIQERFWYNDSLDFKQYMAPGILAVLVTIIGLFLSSMNVVKEKEIGTIEQLNVTPIKKHEFILGKLFPFWLVALFELAFGLMLAKFIFDIPIRGNLLLLFSLASIYLVVLLAIGLFISTITDTQQQALFISWFFMVLFILMSGLFTPIDSMPKWAQYVAYLNPAAHFVEVNRRILQKGSGFMEVIEQFRVLLVYAIVMLSLAMLKYKKS